MQSVDLYTNTNHQCGHCGFAYSAPVTGLEASCNGDAPGGWIFTHLTRDIYPRIPENKILHLCQPGDSTPHTGKRNPQFKLIIEGGMIETTPDINSYMSDIAKKLPPRGLLVISIARKVTLQPASHFFGKNSLQILLERHGFLLAGRPWKWRFRQIWDRKRRYLLVRKT